MTIEPHALIRITFTQAAPFVWTEAAWQKTVVQASLDLEIKNLTSHLASLVRQKASADVELSRKMRSGKLRLVLHSSKVSISACTWGALTLDSHLRIQLVRDLFSDPNCISGSVYIEVSLRLERDASRNWSVEDNVYIPSPPMRPDFYRIGYVSIPVEEYPEALAKRRKGKTGPSYTWALVTWRNETTNTWEFRRVHAYDFDDYCIGDADEHTSWNGFVWGTECHFLGPYTYVYEQFNGKAKLIALLEEHIADDMAEIAPGVPFLPSYTFNQYIPSEHQMGLTEWPRDGIDVVVRCVNHLSGKLGKISFPRDIYFFVEEGDGPGDVVRDVCERVDTAGVFDGYRVDSKVLFSGSKRSGWTMELWAMPQIENAFKLYRYTSGSLGSWLDSSPRVRKREKRIYVEAHFVAARRI